MDVRVLDTGCGGAEGTESEIGRLGFTPWLLCQVTQLPGDCVSYEISNSE